MQHLRFLVPRCLLADPLSQNAVLSVETGRAAFSFVLSSKQEASRIADNKKARSLVARASKRYSRSRNYLILVSLNSTCLRAIGSYLVFVILSVIVRLFFVVT
jgi:hypothetical protein